MMEDSVKSKLGWLLRIAPAQSNDAKVDTTLALAVFVLCIYLLKKNVCMLIGKTYGHGV